MVAPKAPVNQHWVPQYYLRTFAIPESASFGMPQVWAFSTLEGAGGPFRTAIRNVCARRYLYSPVDRNGRRCPAMEERLGRLEHLASRIWPALSKQALDLAHPNIRRCIALVVATLHLRHPRALEVIAQQHAELLREGEQRIPRPSQESALSGGPSELVGPHGHDTAFQQDLLRIRGMTENDKHWLFVEAIRRNAMRIAEGLIQKRWSIVVSDTPQFLTSDAPVHAIASSGQTTGPLSAGALITFPVSPTRVLLMDDKHHEPANQYYAVKGDTPAAQTLWQMRNAIRFVFSSFPIDPALARMLGAFSPDR